MVSLLCCNDSILTLELSPHFYHIIQTLQNVSQTCIPYHIFSNFLSAPLTYQQLLFPKYPVFFKQPCHYTGYCFPPTSPDKSLSILHGHGESPPPHSTFWHLPIEKENAHNTLQTSSGCTAPFSSFLTFSSKTEEGGSRSSAWGELIWQGLFLFLDMGSFCLKWDIFWCLSKQRHFSFLSFPSFFIYFVLRGNFAPFGSSFCAHILTAAPSERKRCEWWHLVTEARPWNFSRNPTQVLSPLWRLPSLPRHSATLSSVSPEHFSYSLRCNNNTLCDNVSCWTVNSRAGSPGFFQLCVYSKHKKVCHIDT